MIQAIFQIIKDLSQIESLFDNEKKVRACIIDFVKELKKKYMVDKEGNLFVFGSNIWLCCHMDKFGKIGKWKEFNNNIQARLDDSIGLGLMLSIIREKNISLLCTIKEERNSELGKKFSMKHKSFGVEKSLNRLKKENPKLIIVIDTTKFGNKGKGPVLYHSSAGEYFRPKIIKKVKAIAKKNKIELQDVKEGKHNDSYTLSKANFSIVAIEIHIDNYHTDHEIASKVDIIELKKLLLEISKKF